MAQQLKAVINWKGHLQEYCQQNKVPLPEYTSFKKDGKWCAICCVDGKESKSDLHDKKIEAEREAAEVLYKILTSTEDDEICSCQDEKCCYESQQSRKQPQPQEIRVPQPAPGPVRMAFVNNILADDFIEHFKFIVRNKNIEITSNPNHRPAVSSPVTLLLTSSVSSIISELINNKILIKFPMSNNPGLQATLLLTLCMELKAEGCCVVDSSLQQSGQVVHASVDDNIIGQRLLASLFNRLV